MRGTRAAIACATSCSGISQQMRRRRRRASVIGLLGKIRDRRSASILALIGSHCCRHCRDRHGCRTSALMVAFPTDACPRPAARRLARRYGAQSGDHCRVRRACLPRTSHPTRCIDRYCDQVRPGAIAAKPPDDRNAHRKQGSVHRPRRRIQPVRAPVRLSGVQASRSRSSPPLAPSCSRPGRRSASPGSHGPPCCRPGSCWRSLPDSPGTSHSRRPSPQCSASVRCSGSTPSSPTSTA